VFALLSNKDISTMIERDGEEKIAGVMR